MTKISNLDASHFQCEAVTVLLGYKNSPEGELHPIMQQRARKAQETAQKFETPIVCTGGWGATFNQHVFPHALHVQKWLQANGVKSEQFLPYAASRNTCEDGKLCADIIRLFKIKTVYLVTSDFHIQRGYLWLRHFSPQVTLIPTPSETEAPGEEMQKLLVHEQQAKARFYQDFPGTPSLDALYNWSEL
ncbi:YdcF family protein [Planctobacterium marinum]|uniref:DUF218 domain-containing protein n=1 Tax=Planctobacterium marinum TaxID=1631968 RepID=A0AA48HV90_9ALTE|nr:hypothetical protein MACH26_41300 [Planctobacterium marinum]